MGENELREEIFVRRGGRIKQGIVIEEGKICAASLHGQQPENPDDNDTPARMGKSSQGSAWGMLQRERVLQGAGKTPAYSAPCRERVNENPAGNPQGAWQIYRKERTKAEAWWHENMPAWKKQLIYEYENIKKKE